jgi:hypothetical protein
MHEQNVYLSADERRRFPALARAERGVAYEPLEDGEADRGGICSSIRGGRSPDEGNLYCATLSLDGAEVSSDMHETREGALAELDRLCAAHARAKAVRPVVRWAEAGGRLYRVRRYVIATVPARAVVRVACYPEGTRQVESRDAVTGRPVPLGAPITATPEWERECPADDLDYAAGQGDPVYRALAESLAG